MILPELAYIDPGSGSLIIQAAIASFVAVGVFFRHQISRLIPRFRGKSDRSAPVDDAAKRG